MPILNYTTKIAIDKTASELQKKLSMAGASAIMSEFDDEGVMNAMSFRIMTKHGLLTFRLPAKIDGVYKRLCEDAEPRYRSREQAGRVAWRITKDWVEAQLAIVDAEQAEMAEVFLPYMQDPKNGRTIYETLEGSGFKALSHDPEF